MRIILVGGGSAGPVTPLVAVQQKIKEQHPEAKFLMIGSKTGPSEQIAQQYGIDFVPISAGKLRRYFTLQNILAPFETVVGFFQSMQIIRRFQPDVIFGAAAYTCVPAMLAGFILRKKIVIHQQDVLPSLTNKILAPLADKVTISFAFSAKNFSTSSGLFGFKNEKKVVFTGNPVRDELLKPVTAEQLEQIRKNFGFSSEQMPVLLVSGGGTGATGINALLEKALPELVKNFQVIHNAGAGKQIAFEHPNYKQFEFISDMPGALKLANIVVARAGLATMTELSVLHKVAVIIPMPNSHQEQNAFILNQLKAAVTLNQLELSPEDLVSILRKLLYDQEWQAELRKNIGQIMPSDAAQRIAAIIVDLCKK